MESTTRTRRPAARRAEAGAARPGGIAAREHAGGGPAEEPAALRIAEAPLFAALALAPLVAGHPEPTAGLWLGGLVWAALLLRLALSPEAPLRLPRPAGLALALPLLALLGLPFSATPGATILQTLLYAAFAAALLLSAEIAGRGGAARLLAALLAGAWLAGALGLREYLEHLRAGEAGWRIFGAYTNPNFFAGLLGPALLLALGAALRRPPAFKPATWTLAMALVVGTLAAALAATASRGGLLAAGVGVAALAGTALLRGIGRPPAAASSGEGPRDGAGREGWARLGLLLAVVAVAGLAASRPLLGREPGAGAPQTAAVPAELCPASGSGGGGGNADSNRFRILTWQGALRMGARRPLLGWGAGTFETAFSPHAVAGYTRQAHNSYLQWFAEQGIAAPAAWIALLLAALVGLLRLPRVPENAWAAGAAGALAAVAVHNIFDSLLFVPAVAFFAWSLLGMGLAGWGAPAQAGAPGPEGARPAAGRREGPPPLRWRAVGIAVAGVGLALTLWHAFGRSLYHAGRAELAAARGIPPAAALDTLRTARFFLPWDHQVAMAQAIGERAQGHWDAALEEGLRALRLAPYRPPTYAFLAELRRFRGELPTAQFQYEAGLRHTPNEVQLLYPYARLLEQRGQPAAAREVYRRIVAVEESPIGQVRALGEVRDYRFARARIALATEAEAAGDRETAFRHRRAAACLLAERRRLFTNNPAAYLALGDWDPETERALRGEEAAQWRWLAEEYRARDENRLAELASGQEAAVQASREPLERLVRELSAAGWNGSPASLGSGE